MSLDEKLRPVGSQSRDFILIRQLHRKELISEKRWNCRPESIIYLKTERLEEITEEDDVEFKKKRGCYILVKYA